MLRRFLALAVVALGLALSSAPALAVCGVAAGTCYWIGGTGSSTQTAHWSATSGGATCSCTPVATDSVIFDASSGGGTYTIASSPTYANFTYVNINKTDVLQFSGGMTIGAAGALSISGVSVTNRAFLNSSVLGTSRAISVPNTATVTLTNVDFQDIAAAGTFGTWTGTSLGDCLGNSGITFDASVAQTLNSTGTVNWSAATWTTRVPLPQDDVDLGSSSTATTLTADMPRLGRNISAASFLKTLSFASTPNTIFGNIELPVGAATLSGTQRLTLAGRSAQTIKSNGKTFLQGITIDAVNGTYTQQDVLTVSLATVINSGTFTSNNFNVNLTSITISSLATINMGFSNWNLSGSSGTLWNPGAGATIVKGTSTIRITSNTLSTTATFAGNGKSYNNIYWSATGATGTLIITGANTAAWIFDGSTARTVQWPASTINTVTSMTQTNAGMGGNRVSFTSSTPGVQATLRKAYGVVSMDYLNLTDSAATGGAQWFAGERSVNSGGNSGWIFIGAPRSSRIHGRTLSMH